MNILFLLRLWPVFGGGETVTRILANEFLSRGLGVHVAYFRDAFFGQTSVVDDRIVCHKMDIIDCDELHYSENDAEQVKSWLCSIIQDFNIDIVINQWMPLSYISDIKTKTNAIVIWCHHTIFAQNVSIPNTLFRKLKYSFFPNHYKMRKIIEAGKSFDNVLEYVDKLVFLSNKYVEQYQQFTSLMEKVSKVCAIPNPLPFNDDMLSIDTAYECKENIILVVARLEEGCKKISRAINVWKAIEKSNNPTLRKWTLQIVGDGPSKEEYISLAQRLSLKRIEFVGFQDPHPYYKKAKILVMTSDVEGFPMSIIEAQHYGCVPVVMETSPAFRDVVTSYQNGIITPLRDESKLTKALIKLMKDDGLLKQMSVNGLYSSKTFTVEKIVDKWQLLFSELQCKKK